MQVCRLTGSEVQKTRPLWEEVFWEDSEEFVDYYYKEKAPHNLTLAIWEKETDMPAAMLHLTSYTMVISGKKYQTCYVVGVATREKYRHQGMMQRLLEEVDIICEEKGIPFVFLMPAHAEIYTPFRFEYVHIRDKWEYGEEWLEQIPKQVPMEQSGGNGAYCGQRELSLTSLRDSGFSYDDIFDRLAYFANKHLALRYDYYIERTAEYFRLQQEELMAQNGSIYILFAADEIAGYFFLIRENDEELINEVLLDETLAGEEICMKHSRWDIIDSPHGGFMARCALWYTGSLKELFEGKKGFLNEIV